MAILLGTVPPGSAGGFGVSWAVAGIGSAMAPSALHAPSAHYAPTKSRRAALAAGWFSRLLMLDPPVVVIRHVGGTWAGAPNEQRETQVFPFAACRT